MFRCGQFTSNLNQIKRKNRLLELNQTNKKKNIVFISVVTAANPIIRLNDYDFWPTFFCMLKKSKDTSTTNAHTKRSTNCILVWWIWRKTTNNIHKHAHAIHSISECTTWIVHKTQTSTTTNELLKHYVKCLFKA